VPPVTTVKETPPRPLEVGDKVTRGQLIGYTGNSGGVGAHLHIKIRDAAPMTDYTNHKNPQWFFNVDKWKWLKNQQPYTEKGQTYY